MNESIAKLANQSGFDVDSTGKFGNYSEMHRLEKLAELIVRECMEQVWYTREDSINGNISEVIKTRISQHFGDLK